MTFDMYINKNRQLRPKKKRQKKKKTGVINLMINNMCIKEKRH